MGTMWGYPLISFDPTKTGVQYALEAKGGYFPIGNLVNPEWQRHRFPPNIVFPRSDSPKFPVWHVGCRVGFRSAWLRFSIRDL